jgi:enoyl-CoA hydratase/carnithine racemase
VDRHVWISDLDARTQFLELSDRVRAAGVLIVQFQESEAGESLPWIDLEPWTRSRAVTVADVRGGLATPALDVALCCDLVYLRRGAQLLLPGPDEAPTSGVVWAMARAGRAALARGLLTGGVVSCDDAVRLGLAQASVEDGRPLPLPDTCSLAALTTARDLMRSRAARGSGLALELASFRLLFATEHPSEGARAFLERRGPRFDSGRSSSEEPAD